MADEINAAGQVDGVDEDLNRVPFAYAPDGAAGQPFRPHVADTGACANAAKAGIGDERYLLAPLQMFERGGQLIGLFHAAAHWPAPDDNQNITGLHLLVGASAFDRCHRGPFTGEDARRADLAIDAVGVDDTGVDRRTLDHRPFGAEVADREGDGAGQAAFAGGFGVHDHVIRVDAILRKENVAHPLTPFTALPFVEQTIQMAPMNGQRIKAQQPQFAQMEHYLRHAAGHKDLHRGVADRPIRQGINQPRHQGVDPLPVGNGGAGQASRIGDGRNMEQQIGAAAKGRVNNHRVMQGIFGQNVFRLQSTGLQVHEGRSRTAGHVEPDRLTRGRQRRVD